MGRDLCLFCVSGIPEDPRVAEEYYADTFDSCSEESEVEEEEETVLAGLEAKVRDKGPQTDCRANQQVWVAAPKRGGLSGLCLPERIKEVLIPGSGSGGTRVYCKGCP